MGEPAREEPGVAWVIRGYDRIAAMFNNVVHFSSTQGTTGHMLGVSPEPYSDEVEALVAKFKPMAPDALLMSDPPRHTRHRALITPRR